jgi:hypothetical protein
MVMAPPDQNELDVPTTLEKPSRPEHMLDLFVSGVDLSGVDDKTLVEGEAKSSASFFPGQRELLDQLEVDPLVLSEHTLRRESDFAKELRGQRTRIGDCLVHAPEHEALKMT